METRAYCFITPLLAVSPVVAEESSVMVLAGDASAAYASGDFVVFERARGSGGAVSTNATAVTTSATAATTGETPPTTTPPDIVARAPIGPGGKFRLEVPVDKPRPVYFAVLDAVTPDGRLVWQLSHKQDATPE